MAYIGNLPVPQATQTRDSFVATSGQTTFTTTDGYSVGFIDVFQEGLRLDNTQYTATDGSTVVLTVGATVGDNIEIISYDAFTVAGVGSIASQNANSVTITGGTIDGTTIGGTTPAAGSFTTVDITSSGNVEGLRINSDGTTTDEAFVVQSNGLTTGYSGLFYTNSSDTGAFNVLGVINDNTLATGSRSLYIKHDPNAEAMRIDAAGLTTNRAFVIQADALTSGELGVFYSNSSVFTNTSTGLVRVHVDHASASGNALFVQNDGTGNGVFIDQNGNGTSLRITSDMTNSYGIYANSSTITSGYLTYLLADSVSFTGRLLSIVQNSAAGTGYPAFIQNNGTGDAVFIDQNGNGVALNIDHEGTTQDAVNISSAATSAFGIEVACDALTTGSVARFTSNSADASARNIVNIIQDHASATSSKALSVRQDAASDCVFIDQDGNGRALSIDSEASSATGVYIDMSVATTAQAIYAYNNSASYSGNLVQAVVDNATATGKGLYVQNDGTGNGVFIDQNGNGTALYIDSEATSADTLVVDSTVSTTGKGIYLNYGGTGRAVDINLVSTGQGIFIAGNTTTSNALQVNADSLTSGTGIYVRSTNVSYAGAGLVYCDVLDSSATGRGLTVQNSGIGNGVFIDQNGNGIALNIDHEGSAVSAVVVNSTVTTQNGILSQCDSLTTGQAIYAYSNSASTSGYTVFRADQANAAATGVIVGRFQKTGTGSGNVLWSSDAGTDTSNYFAKTGASGDVAQIVNAGTGRGLFIDHNNASGVALSIETSTASVNGGGITLATTAQTNGNAFYIVDSGLTWTSATGAYIYTNSSVFSGQMLSLQIDHASASGKGLNVVNDGTGNGVFIDQNGNGTALNIDPESTSANVIQVVSATTTGFDQYIQSDALTTGGGIYAYSNSASYSGAGLVRAVLDNASASGTALLVTNDGTGNGVFIDQNGNGRALNIDSESTTGNTIYVSAQTTTDSSLRYVADALTTGSAAYFSTGNASYTGTNAVLRAASTNVSSSGTVFRVDNSGTGNGVFIDQNGNGTALNIDPESTSANVIQVVSATTTGFDQYIQSDALTTGGGIYAYSNSASYSGAGLVRAVLDNASASGTALLVTNDGTGNGVFIDQNGSGRALNIDSEATGSNVIFADAPTATWITRFENSHASTPYGQYIKYNAASPNGTGNAFLQCDDSTAPRAVIRSNGGIANYSANDVNLSDERLKHNIAPIGSMWSAIKGIEVVDYCYIDQCDDVPNLGAIAQQVEEVAPRFVSNDGFGETPEDGIPYKTIYETDLKYGMLKALQEAMERIEALEAEIAALKGA